MSTSKGGNTVIAIVIGLVGGILFSAISGAPIMGCIVGALFASIECALLVAECDPRASGIVALAFFIKFILSMYQAINKDLPLGGEDWWNYHNSAIGIINSYGAFAGLFQSSTDLFAKPVAILYSIFGTHTMYINFFVLGTSFAAARYVLRAALLVTDYDYDASYAALKAFLFWPIDIVYSVTYLREMPVQMLVICSFYHFIAFKQSRNAGRLIMAFVTIALACMMHSGVIAVMFVYLAFSLVNKENTEYRIFSVKNLALIGIALLIIVVSPLWSLISAKLGNVTTAEGLIARASQFDIDANTKYITDIPSSIGGLILQMPYRAALFAVVPLPWMVYSTGTAIAFVIDAIPMWWLLYRLIKLNGLTKHTRKRVFYVVCIFAVIGTFLICGLGTTAYGNAIRHRAKILPIILVFAVGLFNHIKNGRELHE